MADIFISYARVDRERAQTLASALGEEGWSVWWDRDIPPGRTFDEVIEEALTAATCVVVLWSHASVHSEWVKAEASEAGRRRILVPVIVGDVTPPLEFRRIQSAALLDWGRLPANPDWRHLCRAIGTLVGRPSKSDASRQTMGAPENIDPAARKPVARPMAGLLAGSALVVRAAVVGAVVVGAAVVGAVAVWGIASRPTAAPAAQPPVVEPVPPVPVVKVEPSPVPMPPTPIPSTVRGDRIGPRPQRSEPVDARPTPPVLAPAPAPTPALAVDTAQVPASVAPTVAPSAPPRPAGADAFDVAYTRGVFRESGRVTIASEGLRYVETSGRSTVDATCGDVRRVHVPTMIVDGQQRMVELHVRDRVLRFTLADTAARNRLASAIAQACGSR